MIFEITVSDWSKQWPDLCGFDGTVFQLSQPIRLTNHIYYIKHHLSANKINITKSMFHGKNHEY